MPRCVTVVRELRDLALVEQASQQPESHPGAVQQMPVDWQEGRFCGAFSGTVSGLFGQTTEVEFLNSPC